MKSVPPYALAIEMLGDGIAVGNCTVSAMERRIETSDLNQFRTTGNERLNRCEVIGLMQRRKDTVSFEARQHVLVDDNGAVVVRAAVNDAMADSNQFDRLGFPQPVARDRNSCRNIGDFVRCEGSIDERRSIARFGAQPRPCADPVDLPFNQPRRIFVFQKSKYLEFDARRSGIDDK